MRGPIISTERSKQTPVMGPAPQNPIAPEVIRVSYPSYGQSISTQPQFMEFIPTPWFPKRCNAHGMMPIWIMFLDLSKLCPYLGFFLAM